MNKFLDFLWVLVNPRFWLITGGDTYCERYDRSLNELLDAGTQFLVLSEYEADFGSYRLWIANYPYACFTSKIEHTLVNGRILGVKVRPSRKTIKRMRDALVKQEPILETFL